MIGSPRKRMLVVGLDCLEPSLALGAWAEAMPNLSKLRASGVWARWRSTIPPITVPAWQSMVTSHDPGTLGIYGFRNRRDTSYTGLETVDSRAVKSRRVWDELSRAGKQNIILGVPLTYPARPLSGVMVAGFPMPGIEANYTYPAAFKAEVARVVEYRADVADFRTHEKARILQELIAMVEARFQLAKHLLATRPWDFFMMVEMGTDRIAHLLWSACDPVHPKFTPDHPLAAACRDYYARCDRLLGELIAPYLDDSHTAIVVVSDHGAQALQGSIRLNEWLIAQGYLTLRERPPHDMPLGRWIETGGVDWQRTQAWAEGGYYGRIMLNVAGREPEGIVPLAARDRLRDEITAGLQAITAPSGAPLATQVYVPEAAFHTVRGVAPDLMVMFDDLRWRSQGSITSVPPASLYSFDNDTGPDEANHAWHGSFVAAGGSVAAQGSLAEGSILDFAPTVLGHLGLDIPGDYQGRAWSLSTNTGSAP